MACASSEPSAWRLGLCTRGRAHWKSFADERSAFDAFRRHPSVSRVLFDACGAPAAFSSHDSVDIAMLLEEQRTGQAISWEAAAARLLDGDIPLVPTDRPRVTQWLLKRSMEMTFNRKSVRFFGASPLRNTSLCYFDVARFPGVQGAVALTCDDAPCRFGPANSRLADVRGLLRAFGARATFMVIGKFVAGHEAELQELLREGHELGNHGMADRAYHADKAVDFALAVDECSEKIRALQRAAGTAEGVRWFRAPHGKFTREMESVLTSRELTNTMCDTYASCPIVQDGEWIGEFLARKATHGSIILLHMPEKGFREWCWTALRGMLAGLQARNLSVVSVGELAHRAGSGARAPCG
eukprot:TRINITY_DN45776_c0_g1_i1.p1 TRINITY_DN45776_c0_g1~~TRINITY_DN45776_c0_g1_i1.p1  ORF type:complete len:355 (+),score=74.39 TRINITY_DN45776_c0_g1_i1:2-1066(+)